MPQVSSRAAAEIGRRIREARLVLGITQQDLGDLAELDWTTIGKIERGVTSPTAESLIRIATALEIDAGSFISGITADAYTQRTHRFTAKDFIRARESRR